MSVKKIVYGWVIQTFEDNKCIEQNFLAGDVVKWEGRGYGDLIEPQLDCEYFHYDMIQPFIKNQLKEGEN